MTNLSLPNLPADSESYHTAYWLKYIVFPLAVALFAGWLLLLLKDRREKKQRLIDTKEAKEQRFQETCTAFRTLAGSVARDLRDATEGNVFYIHSNTLATIKTGVAGLSQVIAGYVAAKLETLRDQYSKLEDKTRAQKDRGMFETGKTIRPGQARRNGKTS